MTREQYETLADIFEESIEAQVEYATEHDDAGSNYSNLPREGGWDYSDGDQRLKEWMEGNEFAIPTDSAWDYLVDEVLDWCDIAPGHIFSAGTTRDKFVVDSYAVGEVESQYSFHDLCDRLELRADECTEFVQLAMNDNKFCLRDNGDGGVLSYTNTDATWVFYVDRAWMIDRLKNIEN